MARIEFPLASGGTVTVESVDGPGVSPAGRGSLERAGATLRSSLTPVIGAASDMVEAFRALPRKPQEVELEFGVTLDASLGAFIAGSSTGVHLNVTLRWGAENPADEPPGER